MAYMTAQVDVDMSNFDTDDLIDEIETRCFTVIENKEADKIKKTDDVMKEIFWRYERGYIEDAMILLERQFPKLHNISKRIK